MPVSTGSVLSVHSIVIFEGQFIIGASLSSRVMFCSHVLLLPQASVAIHVLVIMVSCGQELPTITSLNVNVGAVSQLSDANAFPVSTGSVLPEHEIVISDGHVM